MSNMYYIYFLLFKLMNLFIISLLISMNISNKFVVVLIIIISMYYLLNKQNYENKYIAKALYLSPTFLIKRIIEIIIILGLILLNLLDVVIIFLLFDYIVKLTINESIFEIYYNTEIKIRRKDESTT